MRPFVGDVVSFTLVDAFGEVRRCSRTQNAELLFGLGLSIGGESMVHALSWLAFALSVAWAWRIAAAKPDNLTAANWTVLGSNRCLCLIVVYRA